MSRSTDKHHGAQPSLEAVLKCNNEWLRAALRLWRDAYESGDPQRLAAAWDATGEYMLGRLPPGAAPVIRAELVFGGLNSSS